ncbi:hypothetical protein ACLOJK_008858 [Asimina triloba]
MPVDLCRPFTTECHRMETEDGVTTSRWTEEEQPPPESRNEKGGHVTTCLCEAHVYASASLMREFPLHIHRACHVIYPPDVRRDCTSLPFFLSFPFLAVHFSSYHHLFMLVLRR